MKLNKEMILMILALAWPTMLEQLMQTAVQYVDTAMVGALGTQATAAVGATSTVNWLISSTISALGIGFLAYISQAIGANEIEKAKKAVAQAVLVTLVTGIFFTVVTVAVSPFVPVWMQVDQSIQALSAQYFMILYLPMLFRCASIIFGTVLRAAKDTKTPMKIGLVMNICNIVLNFILIYPSSTIHIYQFEIAFYGADLGVIGAAVASAISFVIGGLLITYRLYKHPYISFKGYSLRPDKAILNQCMKVAFPNMLQRFGTSLGYVFFAAMINSLGNVATAAHTIANTVESAFYIPGYGMQTAAASLTGNAYGARDAKKIDDLSQMFILIEIVLMMISGAGLFITAPSLMAIFSSNPEVIQLGSTVLRMVAVSEPFYGFSIIIEGMMQGVGQTKLPFWFNIIGMWLIRIVGTFICTQKGNMGLVSAWACMIAHNLFLFILFLICHKRKKWNPLKEEF